jgi:hypothetical protein
MTVSTDVQSVEKQVGVWLSAHHIVLYVLLAASLGLGIYFIESKYADIQEARASAAEQALAVEKDNESKLTQAYQQAQAQRDAQNAQFQQTILSLQKQVQVQIVHDKSLPAPELGHRIETLTDFKQGTITLNSTDDLIVPLPLGRQIVAQLDQGLSDAQTVVQQAGIIRNDGAQITAQAGIIAEDKKVLQDQITTDAKVLNAEKAKCRKSKWRWFGAGYIAGFLSREIIKP